MSYQTVKIGVEEHAAAVTISSSVGYGLIAYITEAVREKNERELPRMLELLKQKQENRELLVQHVKSILSYNVIKAEKEKQEFTDLVKQVFNVA